MRNQLVVFIVLAASFSFGQIENLKTAQDKRKEYIGQNGNPNQIKSKTLYVNPFIGTGGHGHTYPGATYPFGMMQLSPDSRYDGWDGCSGYHYSDSIIYGFSHTHLSGTGVSDYGDLLVVPQQGIALIEPGYMSDNGYGAHFSHKNEVARPGFYSVKLDNQIDVRLVTSERCGIHEYTFNSPDEEKHILIDLNHRDKLLDAAINLVDKQTITGHRISQAWANEQHFYFYMHTDVPFVRSRMINKKGIAKLLLTFPKETKTIRLYVGMSPVDISGAEQNFTEEIKGKSFNQVYAATNSAWEKELATIDIETFDEDTKSIFYTALYHSYLAPNCFTDVDGRYRGRDMQIHQLADLEDKQYTVFSLWDTYRATHPLYTIFQQRRTNEFIRTFLRQFKEGGDLPVWELAACETECMIGFHSVSVIADAFAKGIRGYNLSEAYHAMKTTSNLQEFSKDYFQVNGYLNAGIEPESVSKALEYAYDNYCVSLMAPEGSEEKKLFEKYSLNFINHFDPSSKFMRARRDGLWFSPFDPSEVNFNYTEANSWQYSLYAPHAVGVLRNLLGGADSLEAWLDRLFTTDMELSGREQADITGLIGQYAHGNEPSHHMAYLYNYTNAPEKTAFYVDRILKEMYQNAPDGLSGNEDCGQMSSWYVLSALGIYQIAPGNPYYEIGRPIINKATLKLESGKSLIVNVYNNSLEAKYVEKISLNGLPLHRNYISHEELINGGELEIHMTEKPISDRDKWSHAPTISKVPDDFVALPTFLTTDKVFTKDLIIEFVQSASKQVKVHYTLDGTEPSPASPIYSTPIHINKSTVVKAFATNGIGNSAVITNSFIKSDTTVSLKLSAHYANQYASSGPLALVDGVVGGNEFRTGDWQGYWAQDVVAELSFSSPKKLSSVEVGALSDMKSWVFLPKEVQLSYSTDGKKFSEPITISYDPEKEADMSPHREEYSFLINSKKPIKAVKIIVKNSGKCPDWHLGAGNDTWLFLDEIILN